LREHFESKTDAENAAAIIRAAILAGTFRRVVDLRVAPALPAAPITLDQFVPVYLERGPQASGKASWKDDEYLLAALRNYEARDGRRLGDWSLAAITEDELEAFRAAQRTMGRSASTLNHLVQVMKAAFRWAARKGYVLRSPISDESALKRAKPAQRTRRLTPDEDTNLLSAAGALTRGAGVRLTGLVVAALETGARRGELLGLQWRDVNLADRELTIRAENAKDSEVRTIPISTRLVAVLEMAKRDRRAAPTHRQPLSSVSSANPSAVSRRRGRRPCCAHGYEPAYVRTALTPESRAQLRAIDLHFHDLRHEAGSRWLEAGMPLHHVKELLGHANISQTDTYLNAGRVALRESMNRFDAARGKTVAKGAHIEHRTLGHIETESVEKERLH
jgi:integrase